jgi:hypothetical protein
MKAITGTLSLILSLAVLAGLGVGGYFALKFTAGLFKSLDTQVAAVTAIASTVMLLASVIIAAGIRKAGRESKANRLRAEKDATYKVFMQLWEELLRQGHGSKDQSPPASNEELEALDRLLILYAGVNVIKAHAALRALVREKGTQHPSVRSMFAGTLVEMRKDLGSQTHGLAAEELLQLLLPDPAKAGASKRTSVYRSLSSQRTLASNP